MIAAIGFPTDARLVIAQPAVGNDGAHSSSAEEEILARLKNQPVGTHTLEAFDIPDDFLRRVANRIIRISYQDRYRMVARDQTPNAPSDPKAPQPRPPARTVAIGDLPSHSQWTIAVAVLAGLAALVTAIAVVLRRSRRAK